MYRIIGITKETPEHKGGMFKVIKKEELNNKFYWHSDRTIDIKWSESDLYKGLNGIIGGTYSNIFIGNSTYIPSGWRDKIQTVNWKYGDIYDVSNPNNATNIPAVQMVQTEQAWTTTVSAEIGLMYLADYYYSLNKTGVNCSVLSNSTYPQCATSWMHLKQNDTILSGSDEWTMSRYGYYSSSGTYAAWGVSSSGYISISNMSNPKVIRPVFYLIPEIKLSGSGTITDPFIIVT